MAKSLICPLGQGAHDRENAITEAQRFFIQTGNTDKESLNCRLIAEEMLNMVYGTLSVEDGIFWLESANNEVSLHLKVNSPVNDVAKSRLLELSSTGKNDSYNGFGGKLLKIIDFMTTGEQIAVEYGHSDTYMQMSSVALKTFESTEWSYQRLREKAETEKRISDSWDNLEKDLLALLTKDIKIKLRPNDLEIIAFKK